MQAENASEQIIPDDERAVRRVLQDLVAAWARHDADAYGALFTEDATYTTWVGSLYRGREVIAESHRALWSSFLKGSTLVDERIDIRFLGRDVAVVTSRGDVLKGRRRRPPGKAQTYTVVRGADGVWRVAAFQNTKRRPLMEAISARLQPATTPSG